MTRWAHQAKCLSVIAVNHALDGIANGASGQSGNVDRLRTDNRIRICPSSALSRQCIDRRDVLGRVNRRDSLWLDRCPFDLFTMLQNLFPLEKRDDSDQSPCALGMLSGVVIEKARRMVE